MAMITIPDYDENKVGWWGAKRDDEMTREQLLAVVRYLRWQLDARNILKEHEHRVLMDDVYKVTIK